MLGKNGERCTSTAGAGRANADFCLPDGEFVCSRVGNGVMVGSGWLQELLRSTGARQESFYPRDEGSKHRKRLERTAGEAVQGGNWKQACFFQCYL